MNFEICGSGVYGVLLAAQLSKISKDSCENIKISLIDKADKILALTLNFNSIFFRRVLF